MNEGARPPPQNQEVQIWGFPNQLPRNGFISWGDKNGPNKTEQNQTMAHTQNHERCSIFYGFHKLLSKIHWELFQHSKTPYRPHQEK